MEYVVMGKHQIRDVIRHLDTAGLDARKWPDALDALASLLQSQTAFLSLHYPHIPVQDTSIQIIGTRCIDNCNECPEPPFSACASCFYVQALKATTAREDSFEEWDNIRILTSTIHCHDKLPSSTQPESKSYHALRCIIPNIPDVKAQLVLLRQTDRDNFTSIELDCIEDLRPQFQRTIRTHLKISELMQIKKIKKKALNRIHIGVVLINSKGSILFRNEHASQILDQDDGLMINHENKLIAIDPQSNKILQSHIRSTLTDLNEYRIEHDYSFHIKRKTKLKPYFVLANGTKHHSYNEKVVSTVIYISDPEINFSLPKCLLSKTFGLTVAETRICIQLSLGSSIKEIAKQLSLSEGTIRQYLKQSYKKTGCHRQSDLVRLVISMPLRSNN